MPMRYMKAFSLFLFLAAPAFAQQCDGPSVTISSNSDVSSISSCGTYNGDIIIDKSATGTIALTGIAHLKGDLTCNNATGLTGISFEKLVTISGDFTLAGLPKLADLTFDSIMEVGNIAFTDLPELQTLDFATGIVTADQVVITNTGLRSLEGVELTACNSLDISHNPRLISIDLAGITNMTEDVVIFDNGPGLNVDLKLLKSSSGINVQAAASLNVPSLDTITGPLGLSYNTFRSFSAPSLTLVMEIAISNNPLLNNLSFPLLSEITGDLTITNNSRLSSISGFPELITISGNLNLTGQFSSVNLPALVDVQGSSNAQTTINNSTICVIIDNSSIFKGVQTCTIGTQSPDSLPDDSQGTTTSTGTGPGNTDTANNSGSSGTNGGSSGSGVSGGVIGGIVGGVVVVLILLCGGWWWFKRRRHSPKAERLHDPADSTPELPSGRHHEKPELVGSDNFGDQKPPSELKSDYKERAELPMDHYVSELEGNNVYEMDTHPRPR